MSKVSTCLWFAKDAEEAVNLYISLLPDSHIDHVLRSPGPWPGGDTGEVTLIEFTLSGQSYQALNGGNAADYGTAASISVECADQAEVDRLWNAAHSEGRNGNFLWVASGQMGRPVANRASDLGEAFGPVGNPSAAEILDTPICKFLLRLDVFSVDRSV